MPLVNALWALTRGAARAGQGAGKFWFEARDTYIVRFSSDNPAYKPECFFYNMLLKHVPFRNETDLRGAQQTYFDACRARGLLADFQQLVDAINDAWVTKGHARDSAEELADKTLLAMGVGRDFVPTQQGAALRAAAAALQQQGVADAGDMDGALRAAAAAERRARFAHELTAMVDEARGRGVVDDSFLPLDPQQRAAVERIVNGPPGMVFLDGCPGVGKSFVTKLAIHLLRERGVDCVIAASSARAARRLTAEATTTNKAFNIPARGAMPPVVAYQDWAERALRAGVVIFEEYSMTSAEHLQFCLSRLVTVKRLTSVDELLATCKVVLVGDRCQLPPVCFHGRSRRRCLGRVLALHEEEELAAAVAAICKRCHIAFSELWKRGEHIELETVHRFAADPEWLRFLAVIRKRRPTQEEINAVLGDLFVSHEEAREWVCEDTIVICSHHAEREMWCDVLYDKAVSAGRALTPVDVKMDTNGASLHSMQDWVAAPGFHQLKRVSVGMRVMLTENIDAEAGALNGAMGKVTEVTLRPGTSDPATIRVSLDETGTEVLLSRTKTEQRRANSGRNPGMNRKSTFPLVCAYAITGHASQGATLFGKVLVHLSSAFAPGLLYVMLSRVPCRRAADGAPLMRIVGRLTPDDFIPMSFD